MAASSLQRNDDLHLVNLPAVGYVFNAKHPLGWCRFEPRGDGATITLRRIDGEPGKAVEPVALKWRAG